MQVQSEQGGGPAGKEPKSPGRPPPPGPLPRPQPGPHVDLHLKPRPDSHMASSRMPL